MDDQAHDHAPQPLARPHGPGRRRIFGVALALAVVAVGLGWSARSSVGAEGPAPGSLEGPGVALQQADRLSLTTTTTVAAPDVPPDGKLIFPVELGDYCWWGTLFGGPSVIPTGHQGLDIMTSAGQPILAVADGVLTARYTNSGTAGYGWRLYDEATNTLYKYFHLAADDAGLREGDVVHLGDVIGYVGDSGTSTGNFHLHFEVWPGYEPDHHTAAPVDPKPLLDIPAMCPD